MKPALRVMLCDDAGERFFGEGPCRLLHLIEETGSLRSAAAQMGLSYSKALRLVQHAEKALGFALTCKTIGGRGGGGSTLTAEARQFLERYEAYRDACVQTSRELYSAFFPSQR
ncbi:winged helix-turn-helix domain-containing protein [Gemmiger formicilis]|uniref:winged helix-turn-helix domain-containing protein n=1 Tax=Gemmiger formicilis TaxID=745368 RepID=UPI003CCB70DE